MSKQKWEEKKTSLGNAIIMSAVMLVAGIFVGVNCNNWFSGFAPYLGIQGNVPSDVDWSPLNEVYNKLATTYNGEISKEEIVEGAKKGLVESLGDVYTVYMDSEETSDFYNDLHGNVGSGIGVEMGLRDGYVRVLRTLPDNPARKAGILAGDIIYKVNGEEKSFIMKREAINNVSAYVEYDGKTAIVTITRFDNNTGTMVQGFAKEFANKGINKVILDLRGNGGGYVSAAQDLLSLWLDNEKILIQKSKHFGNTTTNSGAGKAILKDMETVVLVNGSTASASEIVAGALQDYNKATVVGETTYGKGVVQNLYDLSGATVLKVTTAEWYTPNDRSINKTGIKPDIEVERTYEDINAMRDPQMDKAKSL